MVDMHLEKRTSYELNGIRLCALWTYHCQIGEPKLIRCVIEAIRPHLGEYFYFSLYQHSALRDATLQRERKTYETGLH